MILTETTYFNGKPVGVIRQNIDTGQVAFTPLHGSSSIWNQEWTSIDELKAAIDQVYRKVES